MEKQIKYVSFHNTLLGEVVNIYIYVCTCMLDVRNKSTHLTKLTLSSLTLKIKSLIAKEFRYQMGCDKITLGTDQTRHKHVFHMRFMQRRRDPRVDTWTSASVGCQRHMLIRFSRTLVERREQKQICSSLCTNALDKRIKPTHKPATVATNL